MLYIYTTAQHLPNFTEDDLILENQQQSDSKGTNKEENRWPHQNPMHTFVWKSEN